MILARGYVPTTQGLLYIADRDVRIETVNYFSTHASSQTVTTYLRSETLGDAEYARHVLAQFWRAKPIGAKGDTEPLGPGDSIEGSTTNPDAVRFVVLGVYL